MPTSRVVGSESKFERLKRKVAAPLVVTGTGFCSAIGAGIFIANHDVTPPPPVIIESEGQSYDQLTFVVTVGESTYYSDLYELGAAVVGATGAIIGLVGAATTVVRTAETLLPEENKSN